MKIKSRYTNKIIGEFDIRPGANLQGADLMGANLQGADLRDAYLRGAYLRGAKGMKERQICPKGKSFRAWKKLANGVICELEIPRGAKKVNHPGSTKCRSNIAKVISMTDGSGKNASQGRSIHDNSFVYKIGETLRVRDFCDDIRIECAPGIHFFLNRKEAENYYY